jgi:hypothetical protein
LKFYHVTLTPAERAELDRMIRVGKGAAVKLAKARILLAADEAEGGPAHTDTQIMASLRVSKNTVCRTRERFVEEGIEAALPLTRLPEKRLKIPDRAQEVPHAVAAQQHGGLDRRILRAPVSELDAACGHQVLPARLGDETAVAVPPVANVDGCEIGHRADVAVFGDAVIHTDRQVAAEIGIGVDEVGLAAAAVVQTSVLGLIAF